MIYFQNQNIVKKKEKKEERERDRRERERERRRQSSSSMRILCYILSKPHRTSLNETKINNLHEKKNFPTKEDAIKCFESYKCKTNKK